MKHKIESILQKALGSHAAFDVFESERKEFGHYSTNAALRLAKHARKDPLKLAHDIVSSVREHEPKGFFEKMEVVPPGFVNFWITPAAITSSFEEILKEKEKYGSSKIGKGKKVQVEFISANPAGPLTLANGRGGFMGEVISNALERAGFSVEREYYVNDTGKQIVTLGKSIAAAAGLAKPEENFYKGEYIKEWAMAHRRVVRRLAVKPLELGQAAAKHFLAEIKFVIKHRAKIFFDRWTSETSIHKKRLTKKALAIFEAKKLAYEKDGAVWLKTTAFGDDKDRVLITREGYPTYFLSDAGHFLETIVRGFHKKILILGPDHYGYVKRIQVAAKILGLKEFGVIVTQAVRLVENGKEVSMSKRRGEFVTFEELIDEVGADAARFFFLMTTPDTHMDFDLNLAKERSNKNPVYYVQYSYVRALGILRKANSKGQIANSRTKRLDLLSTPEDIALMVKLLQFPEVIEAAAEDLNVQRLTRYATDLANTFHQFYEKERILGEEPHLASARRELVSATAIVLKNLLGILGVSTPKKM